MPDQGLQPPYLDPSQYPNYLDLQRKQMLAQMLTQTAQQSAQTPAEWNSMRMVPKRSALSNVTTLVSGLMAGKAMQGANQAQQNYFQGLMGGGPSSPPAAAPAPQAPPPSAPGLLPPNGIPGSQGPPGPAAGPSGAAPGLVAPQGPPAASPRNPMIPEGMDNRTAQGALQMMGPAEYAKSFIAPQYQPTDIEKLIRAAGITDPTLRTQIVQAALAKQNYIAPTAARPGTVLVGSDGQPKFYNSGAPEGSMPEFGPDGRPTAIVPIAGGAEATARAAAEKTAGTVSQTPQKVGVDAQGRDVFVYPTPPALAGAGHGTVGAPNAPAPAGGGQTASAATLQSQKSGAEAGQSYASELSKNATGATEVRRSLSELKNLASQATPGAMNEGKMKLGSYMIAAGVDPQTAAGWLGVDVGALQAAQKQTATLAVNTIHSMTSRGTNFDLDTFMRNNPNMNMSDPSSFQRVVDYMDNKSKQEIAKQKDFVNWKKGISPDDWESGHTAHWLEQQNQGIDAGQSNSRPPLTSFLKP